MKRLILLSGPPGVGKSAVGKRLKMKLERSVFLDGDWCWDLHPFVVNEETKRLARANIRALLGNFLKSPCGGKHRVLLGDARGCRRALRTGGAGSDRV